jgi:hypothetical protein
MISVSVLDLRQAIEHLSDDTVLVFNLLSPNPYGNLNNITIEVETYDEELGDAVNVITLRS